MPIFTTFIQRGTGSPSQIDRVRERNKGYPNWKVCQSALCCCDKIPKTERLNSCGKAEHHGGGGFMVEQN